MCSLQRPFKLNLGPSIGFCNFLPMKFRLRSCLDDCSRIAKAKEAKTIRQQPIKSKLIGNFESLNMLLKMLSLGLCQKPGQLKKLKQTVIVPVKVVVHASFPG